jgi:amino acid transporter
MARQGAMPRIFARIHPRYQSPDVSTLLMGVLSIVWYVGLTAINENILADSFLALGLMIAFYYGLTGYACVVYFRRELFKSARNLFYIGVLPLLGAISLTYIFGRSLWDFAKPDSGAIKVFGVGGPLVIGLGGLLVGVLLMIWWNVKHPDFFRRRVEVADPALLDEPAPG